MGGYSVISDIGNAIIQLLRQHMVPDIILNADAINLSSPQDKGDFTLCVYLYDVRESEEIRTNGFMTSGLNQQKYPPSYLSLYYMITAYSKSDVKFKAAEEHRILGRAVQILKDNPVLQSDTLEFVDGKSANGETIKIEMINMDTAEKIKLWNFPNTAYKLSMFYKVTPVALESNKVRKVTRVTDINLTIQE